MADRALKQQLKDVARARLLSIFDKPSGVGMAIATNREASNISWFVNNL
jgi:hypothetical protein